MEGEKFVDHEKDPGGPTSAGGVTQATLASWRGGEASVEDVKNLGRDEQGQIAIAMYWNVVRGDDLPGGLDIAVADCAYNSGPPQAARLLQRVLGVTDDGFIGEKTIAAARAADTVATIKAFDDFRIGFLKSLKTWPTFGEGWTKRVRVVEEHALALVRSTIVEAGLPRSKIVLGSTAGLLASITAVATAFPEIITAGQRAHEAISAGDVAQMATGLAGAIGTLWAIYSRIQIWRAGRLTIAPPASAGMKA